MPSFEDLHLQPAVAANLDQLGWTPEDPLARDAAPVAGRGHNLVAVTPPAPAYAAPALGAMLSRLQEGKRGLVLAPQPQLEQWGALVHRLTHGSRTRVQVARGNARVMRRLRADSVDLVVTTWETALALVTRSALQMESIESLLLAWPEMLPDEDAITPLMQDLPREAQRIVYTSEAERGPGLVDRYARKAVTIGNGATAPSASPVRTVGTSWEGRIRALGELIELLDPASAAIWTVDRHYHEAIAETAGLPDLQLTTGDVTNAETVIAFDLPTGERFQQLLTAGEVVLLVPPDAEVYVARIAGKRRPLLLPGPVDEARSAEAAQRATIVQAIEAEKPSRTLLTLAPLFERYDATLVAAALYHLWSGSARNQTPPSESPAPTTKVYVGLGKKDGANPNELVAVLTKELRIERSKIGRIELRDTYSLIELPAQEAEQVATALNGRTIRKKRVTARVDRGPSQSTRGDAGRPERPPRRVDRR